MPDSVHVNRAFGKGHNQSDHLCASARDTTCRSLGNDREQIHVACNASFLSVLGRHDNTWVDWAAGDANVNPDADATCLARPIVMVHVGQRYQ